MKRERTSISGAFVIVPEPQVDERGSFARLWCRREFAAWGLTAEWAQISASQNRQVGTLRGMHYQAAPHAEIKLVRCTQGAIWDVLVDLRPDSSSFRRWHGVELSAVNRRALYVPAGVAHGFQVLQPDSEVLYHISEFYSAEASRGVRWDDPAFGIHWPLPAPILSPRDAAHPDFTP